MARQPEPLRLPGQQRARRLEPVGADAADREVAVVGLEPELALGRLERRGSGRARRLLDTSAQKRPAREAGGGGRAGEQASGRASGRAGRRAASAQNYDPLRR